MDNKICDVSDTCTVGDLKEYLSRFDDDRKVLCWLPGSCISLRPQSERGGIVFVEGSVNPGSALCE